MALLAVSADMRTQANSLSGIVGGVQLPITPEVVRSPKNFWETGRVSGDEGASMRLNDYQAEARKTDRAADKTLAFPLLGLFGVNRLANLTPYRRPILTPLSGGF